MRTVTERLARYATTVGVLLVGPRTDTPENEITCDELVAIGALDPNHCCIECHAEADLGCTLPDDDPATLHFYNGIHIVEDSVGRVQLARGYHAMACCGLQQLILSPNSGVGTTEIESWITEVERLREGVK